MSFGYFINSSTINIQTKIDDFINNINIVTTLNNTKSIVLSFKDENEEFNLKLNRKNINELNYLYENKTSSKVEYLLYDIELNKYESNITNLDLSNEIILNNFINSKFIECINDTCFYKSKESSLNSETLLRYSFKDDNNLKKLIKIIIILSLIASD